MQQDTPALGSASKTERLPPPLVLSIRGLRKDRAHARSEAYSLRVPHLDVRLGEKILITGPSGSGKSTLLDMLGMILRPDAVERFAFLPEARSLPEPQQLGGGARDVARAWAHGRAEELALWRQHVGYVLQTGGLLPFLSVRENIRIPRKLLGLAPDTPPEALCAELGIQGLLDKLPADLSVGERQRVAIARALAASPPLVLADEPTAALDPANASAVLALFSRMVEELGTTLILVSHAPDQMRGMGFRHLSVALHGQEANDATGTVAVLSDHGAGKDGPPVSEACPGMREAR